MSTDALPNFSTMALIRSLAAVAAFTLVQQTSAWDINLPSCTSPFQPFVYSGCYDDSGKEPALSFRSNLPNNMTVEECVADCKGNGYRYAGLEYGSEWSVIIALSDTPRVLY